MNNTIIIPDTIVESSSSNNNSNDNNNKKEESDRSSSDSIKPGSKSKPASPEVVVVEKVKTKRKKASKAFQEKNVEASMKIHSTTPPMDEDGDTHIGKEKHKKVGDYLKSIIYGGLDGIMTSFAVVTAAAGATLGIQVVLILGISNIISNGISMGVADFISGKAEIDHARAEKKREEWEYENYPQGEIAEMIEIYEQKGMTEQHAKELVEALSKHKESFIDTMMVEELGVQSPDPNDNPAKDGFVTFVSFVVCGLVPLLPFMIGLGINTEFETLFGVSCALVAIVMFALGAITSIFTIIPWWKGGLYMLFVGVFGAVASYLIGWGVGFLVSSPAPAAVCNCALPPPHHA